MEFTKKTRIKFDKLKSYLESLPAVVVGLSGGSDSLTLLYILSKIKSKSMIKPVIVNFPFLITSAFQNAILFCKYIDIPLEIIYIRYEELPMSILKNNKMRCYYCKYFLFELILKYAKKNDINIVLEGSNESDKNFYRPGTKALKELKILSPFAINSITKTEINEYSKHLSLDKWILPSNSCYATRIKEHQHINNNKLNLINEIENHLFISGFRDFRAKIDKNNVSVEINSDEMLNLTDNDIEEIKNIIINHKYNLLDIKNKIT